MGLQALGSRQPSEVAIESTERKVARFACNVDEQAVGEPDLPAGAEILERRLDDVDVLERSVWCRRRPSITAPISTRSRS